MSLPRYERDEFSNFYFDIISPTMKIALHKFLYNSLLKKLFSKKITYTLRNIFLLDKTGLASETILMPRLSV